MKAVRMVGAGLPLEDQEIPVPQIGSQDVLVKIKAAGICHSDEHYRAGLSFMSKLPVTLGHEIAGIIEKVGSEVSGLKIGNRVCLHYLVTCGHCAYCLGGQEQFCAHANMLGHQIDGGYAEYIAVPARNAFILPDNISFAEGATMMCASVTSFHALLKARIKPGDTVAVFGMGGLGQSAVQLAKACGGVKVYAVDQNPAKLKMAEEYGCISINAKTVDPVAKIKEFNDGKGVDVSLELIGLPITQKQAINVAGVMGRVVMVGLSQKPIEINTYKEILGNEVEIIGSNDHHAAEIPKLLEFAKNGSLRTGEVVTATVPLEAKAINKVLDDMASFKGNAIRTVILPDGE